MSAASPSTADPVVALESRLGADWPALRAARSLARQKRAELAGDLADLSTEDTSIVVFGSLAREEFTQGSDIDWALLVDGGSDPQHLDTALRVEQAVTGRQPGREGTFGGLTFSHQLIHTIGGSDDTNRNMTQRILMLLESAPIDRPEAHDRVIQNILRRYVEEDYGLLQQRSPSNVPRFLQNDIARYWRTVAVDFAYKQRTRAQESWALKTVKLRMSRKLTYAAGLLMCFSCASAFPKPELGRRDTDELSTLVRQHLWRMTQLTPLEILAETLNRASERDKIALKLFGSYDQFLGMLNDGAQRDHLGRLPRDDADKDGLYQSCRAMGHEFQDGLTKLFFGDAPMGYRELTEVYGVF